MKRPVKHEALSIPNLITYFRLLLIPVFVFVYFEGRYGWSLAAMLLSGATDVADGYIARRFDLVTDIGKVIDPVADKLTQAAMFFCVAWSVPAVWGLLCLLAVKELVMLFWGWYALRHTGQVNSARWYGKVCTGVLYAAMAVLVVFRRLPREAVWGITILCAAVMLMSLILYSRWYILYLRSQRRSDIKLVEHSVIGSNISMIAAEIMAVVLLVSGVLAYIYRNDLTVEHIVNFTPHNLWLAVLVFMGLFAAKSVTVVVYQKILYIAAGVVFPLPMALAVNLAGTAVEMTIPYLMGRLGGKQSAEVLLQRRPKLRRVQAFRSENTFWFSVLTHAVGVIPTDPLSIYFGASATPYGDFLFGGLLGFLPTLVITTLMGTRMENPASAGFILSTSLFVLVQAAAAIVFAVWVKKKPGKPSDDGMES